MIKLPKKVFGAETSFEGHSLTCKATGEQYNGVDTLAWYHRDGSKAFRSVNGVITFLEPQGINEPSISVGLSDIEIDKLNQCAIKALAQRNYLASFIAEQDPNLARNAAGVGQIINLALNIYNK